MQNRVDKEEIKKQIDDIIRLMEEQVSAARHKKDLIDNLITTSEKSTEQIEKLKQASSEKSRKHRLLSQCTPARIGSALLVVLFMSLLVYWLL